MIENEDLALDKKVFWRQYHSVKDGNIKEIRIKKAGVECIIDGNRDEEIRVSELFKTEEEVKLIILDEQIKEIKVEICKKAEKLRDFRSSKKEIREKQLIVGLAELT